MKIKLVLQDSLFVFASYELEVRSAGELHEPQTAIHTNFRHIIEKANLVYDITHDRWVKTRGLESDSAARLALERLIKQTAHLLPVATAIKSQALPGWIDALVVIDNAGEPIFTLGYGVSSRSVGHPRKICLETGPFRVFRRELLKHRSPGVTPPDTFSTPPLVSVRSKNDITGSSIMIHQENGYFFYISRMLLLAGREFGVLDFKTRAELNAAVDKALSATITANGGAV